MSTPETPDPSPARPDPWAGIVAVLALMLLLQLDACGEDPDITWLKEQNRGRGVQIHQLQQEVARLREHTGLDSVPADSVPSPGPATADSPAAGPTP